MMNITIREAGTNDAVQIADISRQTFYETFAAFNSAANMKKFLREQFTRGRLILEVGKPGIYFYLAYMDNDLSGYLKLINDNAADKMEIARIYVLQSFVGAGVGKALMKKSIELCKKLGKQRLVLGVWEKNTKAIDFYTSWGFKKTGEQTFLLGDDLQIDWVMELRIQSNSIGLNPDI